MERRKSQWMIINKVLHFSVSFFFFFFFFVGEFFEGFLCFVFSITLNYKAHNVDKFIYDETF